MTSSSPIRRHHFSLLEMIVAFGVFLIILGSFMTFFHASTQLNRQGVERTVRYQRARAVHQAWRQALAATDETRWRVDGAVFTGGGATVTPRDHALLFEHGGDVRRVALPRDAEVEFSIEQKADYRLAVLDLHFRARPGFRRERLRLTARTP